MYGRGVTSYDLDILRELQKIFSKSIVKIDFDILSEPCIFFKYKGPFDVVYKLSRDGTYQRSLGHYVIQARNAIYAYARKRNEEIINAQEEMKYQEGTLKMRDKIRKEGFKDDFPKE